MMPLRAPWRPRHGRLALVPLATLALGACFAQTTVVPKTARVLNVAAASKLSEAVRAEQSRLRARATLRAERCKPVTDERQASECRLRAVDEVYLEEAPTVARLQHLVDMQHLLDDAITAADACEAEMQAEKETKPCAQVARAQLDAVLADVLLLLADFERPTGAPAVSGSSAAAPAASTGAP